MKFVLIFIYLFLLCGCVSGSIVDDENKMILKYENILSKLDIQIEHFEDEFLNCDKKDHNCNEKYYNEIIRYSEARDIIRKTYIELLDMYREAKILDNQHKNNIYNSINSLSILNNQFKIDNLQNKVNYLDRHQ